ncbi:MAG TPA: PDZ domain-containing protein [Blastocatellia bacterium]|jgi:serine protease Do
MKLSLSLCLTLVLSGSSIALAGAGSTYNYDQETAPRPVRAGIQSRGFLGVDLGEVTQDSASRLKLRDERGALVTSVIGESAAAKAGLMKDDVIVKWNGEAVESAEELSRHIRETPAGRTVRLGVIRNGSETEMTVTLGDRADYRGRVRIDRGSERTIYRASPAAERVQRERPERELRMRMSPGYRMGVSLQGMSAQLAEYFGVSNHNAALVVYVHPDSPAAKAGIKAGDVILSVAGQSVEHPLSIHRILKGRSEGPTEVKVMREKQERTFTVQLEAEKVSSYEFSPDEFDDIIVRVPNVIVPRVIVPTTIMPRALVQSIAPVPSFKYRYASPVVAPVTIPKITIPKIVVPRMNITPMRIVIPVRLFVNPV